MRVRIFFFGMLKDLAGKSSDWLELPEPASVADVLAHYQAHIPRLKDSLPSLAVAVNQQYAGRETKLKTDDEVALLPPVSGGSGEAAGGRLAGQPAGRRGYASIVREAIDTQQVLANLKRSEDGAAVSSKAWCATRLAGAGRSISTTRPMREWPSSKWKRWPNSR